MSEAQEARFCRRFLLENNLLKETWLTYTELKMLPVPPMCDGELGRKRIDAKFCSEYCRTKSWADVNRPNVTQLDLELDAVVPPYGGKPPRHRDAIHTEDDAADQIERFLNELQTSVLLECREGGTGNAYELSERIPMWYYTCFPRCTELEKMGYIVRLQRAERSKVGKPLYITRPTGTSRGRGAVYTITELGMRWLERNYDNKKGGSS